MTGKIYMEHSQMIWNSILSAKRDKTELPVIWLDLANAVPHHLIRMALEFFNFPSKGGEINEILQFSFHEIYR